ncbi:MAG: DUF6428 family protein [Flavobacterium sp.]|nr:DUF6428 family protein [Flavobacterium sp.]
MKLSEIKKYLATAEAVNFELPNGTMVPENFHVTEIGVVTKHFIDCGGTVRLEKVANFQLWDANDYDHRLKPRKLLGIIALSEKVLGIEDLEIEVEFQSETIGKYNLDYNGKNFLLLFKHTDCLAKENCGIPNDNNKITTSTCCAPGAGCC